jgi:hypothetical protein
MERKGLLATHAKCSCTTAAGSSWYMTGMLLPGSWSNLHSIVPTSADNSFPVKNK